MRKELKSTIAKVAICSFALIALVGCGSKSDSDEGGQGNNVGHAGLNPTPGEVQMSTEDTSTDDTTTDEGSSTEDTSELTAADGVIYLNSFTEGTAGWTEDDWVQFANDMYIKACETEMDYETFSYMEVNYDSSIQVEGVDYYQCVDYSSISEATADYYSLFSINGRENKFDNLLKEQNGKLYLAPVGRGGDICYKESAVLYILEIGDNYVVFNVENYYYDDQYFGTEEMEEHVNVVNDNFTLVFEDRVWKVGTFTIPY